MNDIRAARDAASGADMVEMRLDTVERPDVAGALQGRRGPVIVTCRASWEGGHFAGSEEERRTLLLAALRSGAEFVDVEAAASFAGDLLAERDGRGVVLSSHVFGECPADLRDRWAALTQSPAEVVKLAVEARSLADTAAVMALAAHGAGDAESRGHVLIAMGDAGIASRVLAARMGNRWTYAGNGVAPGQVPIERMRDEFRVSEVTAATAVYGVVGNPVMHSLSPAMHNAGFRHFGLDAVYLPLLAADASDFVGFARAIGIAGASITAPFKIALMNAVEEADELSHRVGAINTLVVRDGRWLGANTDVHGFAAPLVAHLRGLMPGWSTVAAGGRALPQEGGSHDTDTAGASRGTADGESHGLGARAMRATILGAGGAARAVAVALADMGAAVTVSARRHDAAREIAALAAGTAGDWPPAPGTWDVLVNTTSPDGDAGVHSPMGAAALDGRVVYDLLYVPPETKLLRDARAAGCRTIGGLDMLIAQAERQFQLWTGRTPPEGLFAQAAGHIAS